MVMNSVSRLTARLGDVASISMGQSPPSSTVNEVGSGLPFIQGNAEFGSRHPKPSRYCTIPKKCANAGDILLSVRAPVGALNIASERLCIGRGIAAITAMHIDARFLWYALAQRIPKLVQVSQGSTFLAVNRVDIERLMIPVPSPSEQRMIAEILFSLDEVIETSQAIVAQVEVIKRGLIKDIFTHGLSKRTFYKVQAEHISKADVPIGWEKVAVSEIASVVGGGTPRRSEEDFWNGDIAWATPTDVTGLIGRNILQTASSITAKGLANSSANLLPQGSLLITTRATVGACAINRVPMATNQGFQNLVPNQSTSVDFLYYLVQHHVRELNRLAAGSTFLEVSKRAVSTLRVNVPSLREQRDIAAIFSTIDDCLDHNRKTVDQLQRTRRGLLSVLLNGQHEVKSRTRVPEP